MSGKKYKWLSWGILGFCVVCLLVLIYPTVLQIIRRDEATSIITEYQRVVEQLPDEIASKAFEDADEYNNTRLKSGTLFGDIDESLYSSILSTQDSMMGYIEIPVVDINIPIYHFSNDTVLSAGIGHIESSSLPCGSETSHTLLVGHRGVPGSRLFTDLDKVVVGDNFYVHILNRTFKYEVTGVNTVTPRELENLRFEQGKNLVTLITCTPYGVNTHRLLVTGECVDTYDSLNSVEHYEGINTEVTLEKRVTFEPAVFIFIGFILLFIIYFVIEKIRGKKGG